MLQICKTLKNLFVCNYNDEMCIDVKLDKTLIGISVEIMPDKA